MAEHAVGDFSYVDKALMTLEQRTGWSERGASSCSGNGLELEMRLPAPGLEILFSFSTVLLFYRGKSDRED